MCGVVGRGVVFSPSPDLTKLTPSSAYRVGFLSRGQGLPWASPGKDPLSRRFSSVSRCLPVILRSYYILRSLRLMQS